MDSIVTEKIRERISVEKADDAYNYNELAKHLLNYILSKKFPISIGVYGKIGSGKSTFVNFLKKISKERKEKIEFITIDAVLFQQSKNSLANEIKKNIGTTYKILLKSVFFLFVVIPFLISITVIVSWLVLNDATIFLPSALISINTLGKTGVILLILFVVFSFLIKHNTLIISSLNKVDNFITNSFFTRGKHIIIIENLDRCTPKNAIYFLEQLKALFLEDSKLKSDKFAYLILCDFDILKSEVKKMYDSNLDVRDYLNKLIEVPFYLPTYEPNLTEKFIETFLNKNLSEKTKNIVQVIKASKANTPRDVKNLLMELDMIFILAKSKDQLTEETIINNIEKILALQIIRAKYPKIYEFIKSDLGDSELKDENTNSSTYESFGTLVYEKEWPKLENYDFTVQKQVGTPYAELPDHQKNILENAETAWKILCAGQLLVDHDMGTYINKVISNDIDMIINIIDNCFPNVSVTVSESINISDSLNIP